MKKRNLKYLLLSIGVCFVFAIIGAVLTGDALENWFTEITLPWFSLPLWAWYIVGGLYYIMVITILYRLLVSKPEPRRTTVICLTIGVIAGNEFWNYLFFGLESVFWGFIGLIPFTILVIILFYKLWNYNRMTAWILCPYLIWLMYDLIWAFNLWKLNG